jgi:hypothetical protein
MAAAKKAAAPKAAPKAVAQAPAEAPAVQAPAETGADQDQDHEPDQAQGQDPAADALKLAPGEVLVVPRKGVARFHRCGMRFERSAPTVLVVADLAEGVLERLRAEPNLVVVGGDADD